jgi:hypothetical protein
MEATVHSGMASAPKRSTPRARRALAPRPVGWHTTDADEIALRRARALLGDEMGLGKTVQAVGACALLKELRSIERVLVVCPVSLKAEWEEQIDKFTDLPLRFVQGTKPSRLECYESPTFFTIANYEQVVRDLAEVNQRLRPDVVILDEAQRKLKMADVLHAGGFAVEAVTPARDAMETALRAAAVANVLLAEDEDAPVPESLLRGELLARAIVCAEDVTHVMQFRQAGSGMAKEDQPAEELLNSSRAVVERLSESIA